MSGRLAILAFALVVFALAQSLLATNRARRIGARWGLGPRADRLLYNVISVERSHWRSLPLGPRSRSQTG